MRRFPSDIPNLTAYRSRDFTMKHPETHDYAWTIGDMTLAEIREHGSVFKYVISLTKYVISMANKTGSPDKNLYRYWRSGLTEFVAIKDYIETRVNFDTLLKTPKAPKLPDIFRFKDFSTCQEFSMRDYWAVKAGKIDGHSWFGWTIQDLTPEDVLECGSVENYVIALTKTMIKMYNYSGLSDEEVYLYWRERTPEFKFVVDYIKSLLPGSKPVASIISKILNTRAIIINLD